MILLEPFLSMNEITKVRLRITQSCVQNNSMIYRQWYRCVMRTSQKIQYRNGIVAGFQRREYILIVIMEVR